MLVVVGVAYVAVTYQRHAIAVEVERGLLEGLDSEVEVISRFISAGGTTLPEMGTATNRRMTLIAVDGTVLADSTSDPQWFDNHAARPEIVAARRDGSGHSRRISDSIGGLHLYAAKRLPDGRFLRISAPLKVESQLAKTLSLPVIASTVLVLVIGGGLMLFQAARIRLRLAELDEVARAFSAGGFERRASLAGQDAIARLGHELNHLGERLQGSLEQIAGQRRLLDGALGALSEGVACIDRLDRVVYANPAWVALAADGAPVIDQPFYHHLQAAALSAAVGEHRAGRKIAEIQGFMHLRRHLRASVADGGAGVLVLVLHDLSEVRRLELARRDFLSSVSHELKTPLTAILGFTDTLLDGVIESDPVIARDFVGRIGRHADRLANLVRDVLTLSRLEQGTWEMRPEQVDLNDLVQEVIDDQKDYGLDRGIEIVWESAKSLPACLDAEILRQVVGNLVSNAVRYNRPHGKVWITIAEVPGDRVSIAVADNGIGVPLEHRERIFERFYRVDAHRSRQTGGTGLGLAIVKHLVQSMGGTVTFQPRAEEGSIFTVVVPINLPMRPVASAH